MTLPASSLDWVLLTYDSHRWPIGFPHVMQRTGTIIFITDQLNSLRVFYLNNLSLAQIFFGRGQRQSKATRH